MYASATYLVSLSHIDIDLQPAVDGILQLIGRSKERKNGPAGIAAPHHTQCAHNTVGMTNPHCTI